MILFSITAYFKTQSEELRQKKKEEHHIYISSKTKIIIFGGLIFDENESPKGLIYILKSKNKTEALSFIKDDPYFIIFEKIEINRFEQKLPNYEINE